MSEDFTPGPPLHPADIQKLRQALVDIKRLKADLADLQNWQSGIRVDGTKSFSNPPTGMRIEIPKPTDESPQGQDSRVRLAKVAGTVSGGGLYSATLYAGGTSLSSGANLSLPGGGGGFGVVLVANTEEDGQPTHWIKTGSFVEVDASAMYRDGKYVYKVSGPPVYRTDSPVTISGSGTTASSSSWQRSTATSGSDYGDCPIVLSVDRVERDDTNNKLVKYTRQVSIDAGGRIFAVTTETASDLLTSC